MNLRKQTMNIRNQTNEFMNKLLKHTCRQIYELGIQDRITDPYEIFRIGVEIGMDPYSVDDYIPDDESKKEDEKQ